MNTVKRVNLNGSNVEQIKSGLNYAYGITVDSPNNHLIFPTRWKRIFCPNLDGSNQITFFSNLGRPLNLALDLPNNHIYWADENTAKIERGNLDGTGRTDIVWIGYAHRVGYSVGVTRSNYRSNAHYPSTGTHLISRGTVIMTPKRRRPSEPFLQLPEKYMFRWLEHF